MSQSLEFNTCEPFSNEETEPVVKRTTEAVEAATEELSSEDAAEKTQKISREQLEELLSKCSCL